MKDEGQNFLSNYPKNKSLSSVQYNLYSAWVLKLILCRELKVNKDWKDPKARVVSPVKPAHQASQVVQEFPETPADRDSRAVLDSLETTGNR